MSLEPKLLAIDPGNNGGFALQRRDGVIELFAMPDTEGDVCDLLRRLCENEITVYLEKVGGFIRGKDGQQPGSAMFSFGEGYGFIKGCCAAMGMSLRLVPPVTWQRGLRLPVAAGLKPAERKRRLKEEAQRRHPELKGITLKTCDALLILDFAVQCEVREWEN